MTKKLVVVVDDVCTPLFNAVVLRTCEEAIDYLINIPIDELWLNDDLTDKTKIVSLVDWIVESYEWESGPRIGKIVYFSKTPDDGNDIVSRLSPLYPTEYIEITPELFDIT